ncbi:hypothetical protein BCD67_03530 [Oscillatoriales cyanobacterium USR001]|nr:hypothetical protein BCD67_03530 [Oscillatoriales cyanobacterium USR001]
MCNSIRGGLFNILANSRNLGEPAPTKTVAKFLRIGIINKGMIFTLYLLKLLLEGLSTVWRTYNEKTTR